MNENDKWFSVRRPEENERPAVGKTEKESCQNKTEKVKEQREIIKNIFHIYCSVQQ